MGVREAERRREDGGWVDMSEKGRKALITFPLSGHNPHTEKMKRNFWAILTRGYSANTRTPTDLFSKISSWVSLSSTDPEKASAFFFNEYMALKGLREKTARTKQEAERKNAAAAAKAAEERFLNGTETPIEKQGRWARLESSSQSSQPTQRKLSAAIFVPEPTPANTLCCILRHEERGECDAYAILGFEVPLLSPLPTKGEEGRMLAMVRREEIERAYGERKRHLSMDLHRRRLRRDVEKAVEVLGRAFEALGGGDGARKKNEEQGGNGGWERTGWPADEPDRWGA